MRLTLLFFLLCIYTYLPLTSQTTQWSDISETRVEGRTLHGPLPSSYRLVTTSAQNLKDILWSAPDESRLSAISSDLLVTVPRPDSGFDTFQIVRYEMMEAGLAEKFPDIRTFHGVNINNPLSTIRADWTVHGFGSVVSRGKGGQYLVSPMLKKDQTVYLSYFRTDYPMPEVPFRCDVKEDNGFGPRAPQQVIGDSTFRSYRLAVATTGEYANFHDANSPADVDTLLSAVVIAVNRVNEVYERDVAVRMVLIDSVTNVFYYDGSTDPFSNGNTGVMLGQNQSNMTSVIGVANYDVGHVFGTGGGGVASLNAPCVDNRKARGVTCLNSPIGDPFYIDYVAHELGHQFGANHTQNNSCNRNGSTAMEPGSASTIMGYAGICAPNVQSNSDAYFHGISVDEIREYISLESGDNCDLPIDWDNNPPVVSASPDYTIPISTPFVLTATALDPNGDPLSYLWEQFDNEVGPIMPPAATNAIGPMFRSFDPAPDPSRFFPRLEDLINNADPQWETLPSVGRPMDFRVTVFDFHEGMAGTSAIDDIVVTTSASAGPFIVTAPNAPDLTLSGGADYEVTWNVANTNTSPVNCSNVDIFLSRDGGMSYTDTLLLNTPNDGSAIVVVPDDTTTQGRIMVKANANVFFDISDQDFEIQEGQEDYFLSSDPQTVEFCEIDANSQAQFEVVVVGVAGYSEPVTLSITSTPPGVIAGLSETDVLPGDTVTLLVTKLLGIPLGANPIILSASSLIGDRNDTLSVDFIDTNAIVGLNVPVDQAFDVSRTPEFSWLSALGQYEIQVATDTNFNEIVFIESLADTSLNSPVVLQDSTLHFWRVRSVSGCHTGEWSTVNSFTTRARICQLIPSLDVPVTIPDNEVVTVTSTIEITDFGIVDDVDIVDLDISHTWVADLDITLISPEGTVVALVDGICGQNDDMLISFDDDASPGAPPCPPTDGGTYQPTSPLAALNGEEMHGTWTIRVSDTFDEDGGTINGWDLAICVDGFQCNHVVTSLNAIGPGSFRDVLACVQNGDTIRFDAGLNAGSIVLDSTIVLDKNVVLDASGVNITLDGSLIDRTFEVAGGASVEIISLQILGGTALTGSGILNRGDLRLQDVVVNKSIPTDQVVFENLGTVILDGNCMIED